MSETTSFEGLFDSLSVQKYSKKKDDWKFVETNIVYCPIRYSSQWIDETFAYYKKDHPEIINLSVVLYCDNKPCGLWPLFYIEGIENPIRSYREYILPPIFIDNLHPRSVKTISQKTIDSLSRFMTGQRINHWNTIEKYISMDGISEWHSQLVYEGNKVDVSYDMYIDLTINQAEWKKHLRKSYKSLISKGGKFWDVNVLTVANKEIFEEFRLLHIDVSGRETRSIETWSLQLKAIKEGKAFLVYLRDHDKRMVGGGLFYINNKFGLYATGAYDRKLFDKPLGHVVQYAAFNEMRSRNIEWYELGHKPCGDCLFEQSDKEKSITMFKQGFATNLAPRFIINVSSNGV